MALGKTSGLENTTEYRGEYEVVAVDESGYYSSAVAMEELCYCVGAISVLEDEIYAAHVSPGEIGSTPEEIMKDFPTEGEKYILEGVKSREYDSSTIETVESKIEGRHEIFQGAKFVIDQEGEIYPETGKS